MPHHRVRPSRPPLNPIELVDLTRSIADEVEAGKYPYFQFDPDDRWHQRLYRDQRVDIWLLSWLPSQGTTLHDHGGSAGAFTVVTGELAEAVFVRGARAGGLSERVHPSGHSVGFDRRHVHDVRNLSAASAVSVHGYSPPLTSMNFFDVQGGELVLDSTLVTDTPEPESVAPQSVAVAS